LLLNNFNSYPLAFLRFSYIIDLATYFLLYTETRIDGVMVSVLTSNAVDRGFDSLSDQTKDYTLAFIASPISTQHKREKTKIGLVGIRIM
jgi:hypothetical protein